MARLIFVYNANAGLIAGLIDSVHKAVSPDTYQCQLCAITYGAFAMDKRWKAYLNRLNLPVDFYHRPDFRAAFRGSDAVDLPLIALDHDGTLDIILSADDLNALPSLDALMAALNDRLTSRGLVKYQNAMILTHECFVIPAKAGIH